jgi:hypothetical protein
MFEGTEFDPRRAASAIEVTEDVDRFEGCAVGANPDAVAGDFVFEKRPVQMADDASVLFGDPRCVQRCEERIGQKLG